MYQTIVKVKTIWYDIRHSTEWQFVDPEGKISLGFLQFVFHHKRDWMRADCTVCIVGLISQFN